MLVAAIGGGRGGDLVSRAGRGSQQPAPAGQPSEYTVKAVFLYSFGRFVEWPEGAMGKASDPLVIGIAGENPFGQGR